MMFKYPVLALFLAASLLVINLSQGADVPEPKPAIRAPLAPESLLLDIVAAGEQQVAVGTRGHILVSDNGAWQQSDVPVRSLLTATYFHDRNLGWAVGHDAVILHTNDGGTTWQIQHYAPELETPFLDVWFRDDRNGLAIGAYGLYYTTSDGGKTWAASGLVIEKELQDDNEGTGEATDFTEYYDLHLNSIAAAPDGTLYIAAEAGRIYRSDNRGENWTELSSPYVGSLFGVLPLDNTSVLVFGLRGHLFLSRDRGRSWQQIDSHTNEMLTNGIQLADGRIVISGLGGTLLTAAADATGFTRQETGTRTGFAALVQTAENTLAVVGEKGVTSLVIDDE